MEAYDSKRIHKLLNLSSGSEIWWIIGCGPLDFQEELYGERFRVETEEIGLWSMI